MIEYEHNRSLKHELASDKKTIDINKAIVMATRYHSHEARHHRPFIAINT